MQGLLPPVATWLLLCQAEMAQWLWVPTLPVSCGTWRLDCGITPTGLCAGEDQWIWEVHWWQMAGFRHWRSNRGGGEPAVSKLQDECLGWVCRAGETASFQQKQEDIKGCGWVIVWRGSKESTKYNKGKERAQRHFPQFYFVLPSSSVNSTVWNIFKKICGKSEQRTVCRGEQVWLGYVFPLWFFFYWIQELCPLHILKSSQQWMYYTYLLQQTSAQLPVFFE